VVLFEAANGFKIIKTEIFVSESTEDRCGKCGAEIDPNRRVDFTLKDGTRVCDSCFVKGTERPRL
jgi:hypothetical protein